MPKKRGQAGWWKYKFKRVLLGRNGLQTTANANRLGARGHTKAPRWILTGDGVTNRATNRAADRARWSQGFAIAVLAATLGLCISLRQILLHIAPDDPGFGTPILGYHLYSWAFGIFIAMLLCSGISLLLTDSLSVIDEAYKKLLLTRISLWVFGLLILANALVVSFTAARGLLAVE